MTANGEFEAEELGRLVHGIAFSHVFTSSLKRARQTCELSGLGAAAEIDPDLAEWHYGDYEGRRTVDIRKEQPDWNAFRDGCPHGESPQQVADRVDRLLARLSLLDGNLALFSHGQLGCVLGARWIGLETVEGQHFHLDSASLSILGGEANHPRLPVIELWNSVPGTPGGRS